MSALDLKRIRSDFPALRQSIRGRPPIYLDSACTTLRPEPVIRAMADFQCRGPTCHGRTNHFFGRETTTAYEGAREVVRDFVGAASSDEIVFVRNTTEAINLVASSFPWQRGDEVWTTDIEHNSNLLPWHRLADRGVRHRVFPLDIERGFSVEAFQKALGPKTRLVAMPHVSNLCGIELPIAEIAQIVHAAGAVFLVDGAQAVTTHVLDLDAMGVDFYAFSFHKMFGPSGIGALYGRREQLESLHPFLLGGGTIDALEGTTPIFEPIPARLEAGVCNYDGAVGGAAAIRWLQSVGQAEILKHVTTLNAIATEGLAGVERITLLGPEDPSLRTSVLSFHIDGLESEAMARLLDTRSNVMVRHGKFCVHNWFNSAPFPDAIRASFSAYNTEEEVRTMIETVRGAALMLA